ncbi:hypothetical protein HYV83_04930 [Candidatus Woesearchaeota archaeon]|nr:hypothetical protein [Candidatus Woesearchaeota archaeon]
MPRTLEKSVVLENIAESADDGGERNGQTIRKHNLRLEQMIFQGEAITAIAAAENIQRGSVHNYMHVHHAVKTPEGYDVHHRYGCGNPNHGSLHAVWSAKRTEMRDKEAAQKERIKRMAQKRKLKKLQQPAIPDAVMAKIVREHGKDPRAVHGTAAYYRNHSLSSLAPESVYCLLQEYWRSSDNDERRTWDSLAHPAGLKYGAEAASVIKGLGLPSLTRVIGYTRRIRVTPEEKMLAEKVHPLPFTTTELRSLLAWPRSYATLEKLLKGIGSRPWASKSPLNPDSRRLAGSYVTAFNIYENRDAGHDVAETAQLNGFEVGTVVRYEKARQVVEPQLKELFSIRNEVLGSKSLSDIVAGKN